jgi:hypothetical protein
VDFCGFVKKPNLTHVEWNRTSIYFMLS